MASYTSTKASLSRSSNAGSETFTFDIASAITGANIPAYATIDKVTVTVWGDIDTATSRGKMTASFGSESICSDVWCGGSAGEVSQSKNLTVSTFFNSGNADAGKLKDSSARLTIVLDGPVMLSEFNHTASWQIKLEWTPHTHSYTTALTAEGRKKHTCHCGHSYTERAYDVNFDNLFSFADWAESSCAKGAGSGSGMLTYNITDGTITLSGSGDFYTAYNGSGNYYCVPVTAGEEYIFRYDSVSSGGKQAFVFFYDDSGNGITGAIHNGVAQSAPHIGKYDGSHIVFTVPNGCTKVGIRVGITGTAEATYSNIAIYKTSVGDIANRQYRMAFFSGEAKELYTPVRDGYKFQGWYTADGVQIVSTSSLTESTVVYSAWKKLPPEYTAVAMTYLGKQISETNKVPCGEGFIISVGIK